MAARGVTQSSATTVGSGGTPTRRVTRLDASEPATLQAAMMPPRCMSSMKNPEEVRLSATVTFVLSLFQTRNQRNVFQFISPSAK